MNTHQAVVRLHDCQAHHHEDGEKCVEVEGNGADEEVQALAVLCKAGNRGGPGGDGGDDADGGGGGVNEVGQLSAGDVILISDRAHHGAHSQAVEVVVNEDQAAQEDGSKLCAHTGLDVALSPAAKGSGAAGLVHQTHHGAQDHQEGQNAHVVAVREDSDDAVGENVVDGTLKAEVGIQQSACQNTHKEGAVDLLGQKGQGNGDDGGQQGPGGIEEVAGGGHIAGAFAGGADIGAAAVLAGLIQAVAAHTGGGSAAVRALNHLGAGFFGGVVAKSGGGHGGEQKQHSHQRQQPPGQVFHGSLSLKK